MPVLHPTHIRIYMRWLCVMVGTYNIYGLCPDSWKKIVIFRMERKSTQQLLDKHINHLGEVLVSLPFPLFLHGLISTIRTKGEGGMGDRRIVVVVITCTPLQVHVHCFVPPSLSLRHHTGACTHVAPCTSSSFIVIREIMQ